MRINILGKTSDRSRSFSTEGGTVSGPVILNGNPVNPLGAATKNYVDLVKNSVNASNISTGILVTNRLPSFNGDIINSLGSNTLTLLPTSVTPGIYTKVTVDAKGRVTYAENINESDLPNFSWGKITTGKPTTLAGYGITDGINPSGDNVNGYITVHSYPQTAYNLANKGYVDGISDVTIELLATGDLIKRPTLNPEDKFLRCTGAEVDKTTYSELYSVIGDYFSYRTIPGNGHPWKLQFMINRENNLDITGWSVYNNLPDTINKSQAIVTNGIVYILGGVVNGSYSSDVYSSTINPDGTLGVWSIDAPLPIELTQSQAVVINNKVYLIGGFTGNLYSSTVYFASINSDGTLGPWSTGPSLPEPISDAQVIVTTNTIYLVGGYNGANWLATIYTATINPDGTLGAWAATDALPDVLGGSHLVVTSNRVYLLGGKTDATNVVSTVYSAPINSDETIGPWVADNSLPIPLTGGQAIVIGGKVFLLGGYNGSSYISSVYISDINTDGTLGSWYSGSPLMDTIFDSTAIITNSKLYLLGGIANDLYSSNVYVANINGGINDYSNYYQSSFFLTDPLGFNIPDTSSTDINGIHTFIKTGVIFIAGN